MAIAGKPAARALRSRGISNMKRSGASKKTKQAYARMANKGKGGFRK